MLHMIKPNNIKSRILGFTLLEMSMVIIIISVVTAMAVSSGISVVENSRQSSTLKKMAEIDKAMLAFRITNDRLPCPAGLTILKGATTYGIEASDAGTCISATQNNRYVNNSAGSTVAVAEGAVPAVTLGLPADYMYDGWGRRIRYAVDVGMTYANSFTNNPAGAKCGAITLRDTSGGAIRSDGTALKGSIYALISHGSNGHGGYTNRGVIFNNGSSDADELVNCHCDASVVDTAYAANYVQKKNSTTFDDIVTYKERPQMQISSDRAGNVCPYIYVNDWVNTSTIKKFDIRGNYLSQFAQAVYSILAVDHGGNLWWNTGSNVQKLDADGNVLSTVNIASGDLSIYGGYMAFDSRNNLWIVDSANHIVNKYDLNANYINSIPPSGTNAASVVNGKFSGPKGIAIDSLDNIWVGDAFNRRVQKFDAAGNWLLSIGWSNTTPDCRTNPSFATGVGDACSPSGGANDGQFANTLFIYPFVDGNDNIWVSDNNRLQEFDSDGNMINKLDRGAACGVGTTLSGVGLTPDGVVWSSSSNGNIRLKKIVMTGYNTATCTTASSTVLSSGGQLVITGR